MDKSPLAPSVTCLHLTTRLKSINLLASLLVALIAVNPLLVKAQDTEGDNPTGPAGDYNGEVTTGGSYDPYTLNIRRSVTDIVVPASNGTYPLAFTRTYNSMESPSGGDTAYFGDGGNWRHSYMWTVSPGVAGPGGGSGPWTVAYPDGATVTFRSGRTTAPSGEPYWRGPTGTNDRLEMTGSGATLHPLCLHLSDGGIVTFGGGNGGYHASTITDPYGAVTKLDYNSVATEVNGVAGTSYYLSKVSEPGGRNLQFTYSTVDYHGSYINGGSTNVYTWVVLTKVTASTGQAVTYNYATFGDGDTELHGAEAPDPYTSPYYVLISVSYDSEPSTAGGSVQANYTYTEQGDAPCLTTAHDPHYAGPMIDIRYSTTVPLEEDNISGQCVSHLDRSPTTPTTNSATETRGDKAAGGASISRTFVYNGNASNTSQQQLYYNPSTQTYISTGASETTDAKNAQLTSYSDYQGQSTYLTYYGQEDKDRNGQGNLRSVEDRLGHITTYGHEPYTGKTTSVLLPDNRSRSSVWSYRDPSNLPPGVTDASQLPYYLRQTVDERGQTTNYTIYTNTGLVSRIDYPDNTYESFAYGSVTYNGNTYWKLAYKRTRLGAELYYTYGANPNANNHLYQASDLLTCLERWYNDGTGNWRSEKTYFSYDAYDRLYQSTDPRGVVTNFIYNQRHQLTQTIHAADGTHVDRSYDDNGNCTNVSDELGHSTSTAYDEYRRPSVTWTPVNDGTSNVHVDYFWYEPHDASHNQLSSSSSHTRSTWSLHSQQSSRATERVYSPNNWLTDTFVGGTAAGGGTYNTAIFSPGTEVERTRTDYNIGGLATISYDGANFQTSYGYDTCNRLTSTQDPNGLQSLSVFYAAGEAASGGSGVNCSGLLKYVTTPGPDATGAPTVNTQYTNYDPNGKVIQTYAPPNGNFANLTLDSAFDASGNLTGQDDGAQTGALAANPPPPPPHQSGYIYDALGRKVSCTYPDGTAEHWTYDASGNVSSYGTRAGQTETFTYDNRNRCTSKTWSNHSAWETDYQYDAASRTTEVRNDYSDIHFTYDDAGDVLTETAQILNLSAKTTTYSYDTDGRVAAIQYPGGDHPVYSYDLHGRCASVSFSGTTYAHYTYDGRGLLSNRCILPSQSLVTAYNYQNNGRTSYVWDFRGDSSGNIATNGSIRLQFYGYAPDGQISWVHRAAGGDQTGRNSALDNDEGDAYYYYSDGSLAGAYRNIGVQGDSYNNWPAQRSPTQSGKVDTANFTYYSGSAPSDYHFYAYDKASNRSTVSGWLPAVNYSGDLENRYSDSTYDTNGNTTTDQTGWTYTYNAQNQLTSAYGPNGVVLLYGYDGLGRLVADNVNGAPRVFYYAGSQRIEEWDNSRNSILRVFEFDGPGSDSIFLCNDAARGYLWYLYDAQGNTTHICDTNGNVLEMYLYDAYGAPTFYDPYGNVRTSGSAYDNHYLFKGAAAYQWYQYLALYYCRARFYEPAHGRWLQPDPIGQAGGLNLYTYCGNDPVNGADPNGLSARFHQFQDLGNGEVGNCDNMSSSGGWNRKGHMESVAEPFDPSPHQTFTPGAGYNGLGGNSAGNSHADPSATGANLFGGMLSGAFKSAMNSARGLSKMATFGFPGADYLNDQVLNTVEEIASNTGWAMADYVGADPYSSAFQKSETGGSFFFHAAAFATGLGEEEVVAEGTTYLYQKFGAAGEHLKFGITNNPVVRYTAAKLSGGRLSIIARGSRPNMLQLERTLHETLPIGPEEGQLFYIQKQVDKGLRPPPYN